MPEDDPKRRRFIVDWSWGFGANKINIDEGNKIGHSKFNGKGKEHLSHYRALELNCLSQFQTNNISDEQRRNEIDDKIENLKILSEQFRKSISAIGEEQGKKEGWQRVPLTVDSGACDTVADSRSFPGYPFQETEASRAGSAFSTAAGDPNPHLGETEIVACIGGGDIRTIRTQCSTVAKPMFSVKQMIEACQFVRFCEAGGFILDTHIGKVDWLREGNGNYILDTWLVPHEKSKSLVDAMNDKGVQRPSN